MLQSIKVAAERYDWLADEEEFRVKSEKPELLAKEIIRALNEAYKPKPNKAFYVEKKHKTGRRLIEKPDWMELIIQYDLLKAIRPYFERVLEKEAKAYRAGASVTDAIDMVHKAVKAGYEYVFETNIEDFFPGIPHQKLFQMLDNLIPQADVKLKIMLQETIKNGYLLKNKKITRTKGLAQGGVLSPLLANIYLDFFDETIKQYDVRLIRFADDVIILSKSRADALAIEKVINH
jgi:retron-type reverse transcriptase